MNPAFLLAVTPYERFMAIKERFSTGGSAGKFFLVIGLLLLAVATLALLATLARRWRARKIYNPRRLFLEVLRSVPLTVPQRDLLRRIARDLRLPHPTVLLLSPHIFTVHANAWMSASRNATPSMRTRLDGLQRAIYAPAAPNA